MTNPTTTEPWTNRLTKFLTTMPRAKAADLATDLEDFKADLEELVETIEELLPHLETWTDDNADRSERADAKESAEDLGNQVHEQMGSLARRMIPVPDQ